MLGKLFLWSCAVLFLVAVGARLFFEDQFNVLTNLFRQPTLHSSAKSLTIAYALPAENLEPTLFDPVTRSRLVDVYQGLVRTDRNLKIQPALAVSWGLLDAKTWEFKLRPGVKFHDGKAFSSADVLASLERARHFQDSQLKNLLSSIADVTAIDPLTIHITTNDPDPLLLNKLAVVFIFPQSLKDFASPVGTGPYRFSSSNGDEILLLRFEEYWGDAPFYQQVVLKTVENKDERQRLLEKGDVQLLADVPPAAAKTLQSHNIMISTTPSLEVNFLMFNLEDPFFADIEVRKAFTQAFDRGKFVDIAGGFARPIGQFVSSGIFGFNPSIALPNYDLQAAKKKIDAATANSFDRVSLTFDYPESLGVIGDYVQAQLSQLGITVELNPLSNLDLQKKISDGTSQLYYLGWRSELGDSDDFLASNIHSRDQNGLYGSFNGAHYANENVDQAIENSRHNLNPQTRLTALQNIMKTIVQDDVVGIPLFEAQTIFAFRKDLHFEPRVDGYIYVSEIRSS